MMKKILLVLLFVLVLSCTDYADGISINIENPVLPILTGKDANPVLKVEVIRQEPVDYSLKKLLFCWKGQPIWFSRLSPSGRYSSTHLSLVGEQL